MLTLLWIFLSSLYVGINTTRFGLANWVRMINCFTLNILFTNTWYVCTNVHVAWSGRFLYVHWDPHTFSVSCRGCSRLRENWVTGDALFTISLSWKYLEMWLIHNLIGLKQITTPHLHQFVQEFLFIVLLLKKFKRRLKYVLWLSFIVIINIIDHNFKNKCTYIIRFY